jgi:hypothetical protein
MYKKNQMHAYEISYKCQLYPTLTNFRTYLQYLSTIILNHPIHTTIKTISVLCAPENTIRQTTFNSIPSLHQQSLYCVR